MPTPVSDGGEIERLNRRLLDRYPALVVFSPASISSVLIRATPTLISIVDYSRGQGHTDLYHVS